MAQLGGKKRVQGSKLEQTILSNRGMNIHLNRRLNIIEVDRKRMLKFDARRQKELQADLRTKKDEKFNLMLKYHMQKTAIAELGCNPPRPNNEFKSDIESELFTSGLVNAPGVNSRMKRLATRTRILPEFEDDDDEEKAERGGEIEQDVSKIDAVDHKNNSSHRHIQIAVPSFPTHQAHKPSQNGRLQSQHPHHFSYEDEEKPKAVVTLTSGIVSVISQNAEIKQINSNVHVEDGRLPDRNVPVPLTGFNIMSSMRTTSVPAHPDNHTTRHDTMTVPAMYNRSKTVQFSRHRDSLAGVDDLFPAGAEDMTPTNRLRSLDGRSRLSVVKSKLETNEKEFLLKLRIQSQKLENDDVARKVWEFIGKRPISMFVPRKISPKSDDDDDDILSEQEEERNMSRFRAAASVTSRNR